MTFTTNLLYDKSNM